MNLYREDHSRTSQQGWGPQPLPESGNSIIFRANAQFFGQKPAAKTEKYIYLYFLNEKTEFIPSKEMKCPKSGIFAILIVG